MRQRFAVATVLVLVAVLASAGPAGADPGGPNTASLLGTGFTYQGRLSSGPAPFTGNCDLAFRLYDDPTSGGLLVAGPLTSTAIAVSDGYFTVPLNFGSVFTGAARWLDLRVRCGADVTFTQLSPRQLLTAAPYALALPGLYTQFNANSPNLIGGYGGNLISGAVVYGVTIGGGGAAGLENRVQGANNATFATIAGGVANVINGFNVYHANIGGGYNNRIGGAASYETTIAGGISNVITGTHSDSAVIGGGADNFIGGAFNYLAVIDGGSTNAIDGADGVRSVIGGGYGNHIGGSNSYDAVIAGGNSNSITGGNSYNAFIGGGFSNAITSADADKAVIGGGSSNVIAGGSNFLTVIGGGGSNLISGPNSSAGAIVGGANNTISGTSAYNSFIGGGASNAIRGTNAYYSFIGGGIGNAISGTNPYEAVIAGGAGNTATDAGAVIGGGNANGAGSYGTVSGGTYNNAAGFFSAIPGGSHNTAAGQYSLAAGLNAQALHNGAFVWADASGAIISSTAANQFVVRASGGITLFSNPTATIGVELAPGAGAWTISSDRNLKANYTPVDSLQVLNALGGISIGTWNYKSQPASIRHLGPMAQDFYAAFGVGETDTGINTVDGQGVALAAIQGLRILDQQKDAQLAAQQAQISALQGTVTQLQAEQTGENARLQALAAGGVSAPAAPPAAINLGWLLFGALLLLNLGGLLGYGLARRAAQPGSRP